MELATTKFAKLDNIKPNMKLTHNRRRLIALGKIARNQYKVVSTPGLINPIELKVKIWMSPFQIQQNKIVEDYDFSQGMFILLNYIKKYSLLDFQFIYVIKGLWILIFSNY